MDREQVVEAYRSRIAAGVRVKLTRAERGFLVDEFVGRLAGKQSAAEIESACREELALIEEGFGCGSNSAINYLSDYRKAVAAAVEARRLPMSEETTVRTVGHRRATGEPFEAANHLAWSLLRYNNSVYLAAREETNRGNNARQDNPQPFVPARFLEKAVELLGASEAEALAVGIAAVTGRRHTEVAVSGQFSLSEHPYVLHFSGQLKKGGRAAAPGPTVGLVRTGELLAYSIGTLVPAVEVMAAIERFRNMPLVQELAGLSSEDRLVVNFRARVNSRVKAHFQRTEILPLLPGFKSVSVHRLRAAYARMLVYFWLPNQGANEQRFLQFYLGHVEADLMATAANSGATNHYFGYRLVGENDRPILASGIKLMAFPPLPNPTESQLTAQQRSNEQLDGLETGAGDETDEHDELEAAEQQANGESLESRTAIRGAGEAADLGAAAHQAATHQESTTAPVDVVATVARLLAALPAKQSGVGSAGLSQTDSKQQPAASASERGTTPTAAAAQDVPDSIQQELHHQHRHDQTDQYHPAARASAADSTPPTTSTSPASTTPTAPATAPTDLPFAALLDQMQSLQQQLALSQAERQSIHLLSEQLDQLREQLLQAQHERDLLQTQLMHLSDLQQENHQLKAQLAEAQHSLHRFAQLAQGLPLPAANWELAAPPAAAAIQSAQSATMASSPATLTTGPQTRPLAVVHPGPLSPAAATDADKGAVPAAPSSSLSLTPLQYQQQPGQQQTIPAPCPDQLAATAPLLLPIDDAHFKTLTAGLSPDDRIPLAIQALVEFNQLCHQPKDRWSITGNILATMSGTNAATRVNPWLDYHPDVASRIYLHNQSMGIDGNYHNRGKDKLQLKQILACFLNRRQLAAQESL